MFKDKRIRIQKHVDPDSDPDPQHWFTVCEMNPLIHGSLVSMKTVVHVDFVFIVL